MTFGQMGVETYRTLEGIRPGLADCLLNAPSERLRRLAAMVANAAARSAGLTDQRVIAALDALESKAGIDYSMFSDLRDRMESLVEELDNIAWDLQEQADASHSSEEEYVQALEKEYAPAFARARAAAAVAFALHPDPLTAATSAIYEAYHSTTGIETLKQIVAELFGQ